MLFQKEGWRIETCLAKGKPLPEWYDARPAQLILGEFFLAAFHELGTERQIGMSLGRIPWSKIVKYAEYVGLDREHTAAFHAVIRTMDDAYLEHVRKEQDKPTPKQPRGRRCTTIGARAAQGAHDDEQRP